MRERTELLIRGMSEARTKRGRWLALVTALAFLTGGNVFWELREIGTALTEDDMCTLEAHEHTESCYDESGTLICGKEEHIHTAACFSDENADLETEEIWELTLPERDGIPRQELTALIAESQLGYAESANNFIRPEDGTQQGYTRYGAWYGNPYGEWNTMFVYFCLYYAGVSTEEIPCAGNARTWQVKLTESGLIRGPDSEPERGGIILLDLDADGAADRAGILTNTEEHLTVIEGDCGNMVAETQYATDAEQILGYVAIPNPDTPADETTAGENPPETEEAPTEETAAEAAEESGAETEPGTEMPMITYKAESESGILVSATAPPDAFPAEVTLRVTDVPHDEALQTASENLETDAEALDAVAVDISFIDAAGTEMEPALDKSVQVQISLPEELYLSGNEYNLLHVSDTGTVEKVDAQIDENNVTFTAESFSIYVVVGSPYYNGGKTPLLIGKIPMADGANGGNSQNNPLLIGIGEKIEVFHEGDDYNDGYFSLSNSNNYLIGEEPSADDTTHRKKRLFTANSAGEVQVQWKPTSSATQPTELLYVKVVNHAIFKMTYTGNRSYLNTDNDYPAIDSYVNNSFTLSMNGDRGADMPSGTPQEQWNASYDISEFLHRDAPIYEDGNTYVTFTCLKTGNTTLQIDGVDIHVNIRPAVYIKLKDGRRLALDDALTELNKGSWPKKLYGVEGETFTFSFDGNNNDLLNSIADSNIIEKTSTVYNNGNTDVTITCKKHGTTTFIVNGERITIEVQHPITVVESLHNRDIDRINEWLGGFGFPKKNGYIPNEADHPYLLFHDDELALNVPLDDLPNGYLECADVSYFDVIEGSLSASNGAVNVTLRAKNQTNQDVVTQIWLKDQNGQIVRTMYVKIKHDTNTVLNHADIEIADGGKYSVTKIKRNADGSYIKTISLYDAYIHKINNSRLYKADNSPTPVYTGNDDNLILLPDVHGFDSEDYWKDPTLDVGDPQYEYTSAYAKDENGRINRMSSKKFHAADVEYVVFDTDLELRPYQKKTTSYSADGTPGTTVTEDISGQSPEIRPNVKFTMDHQEIIDALNKCPHHNGLDFTITAFAAMVEFDLSKELTGGTIQENQFSFSLTRQEIATEITQQANVGVDKSKFKTWLDQGLTPQSYRIFYSPDGTVNNIEWGEGVDGDAVIAELQTIPGYENLNSAGSVFGAVLYRSPTDILQVLKKHLLNPETLTENNENTQYVLQNDGYHLFVFGSDTPLQTVSNRVQTLTSGEKQGLVTFDALLFDTPGEYTYLIRENAGNGENILYDNKTIEMKIVVTRDEHNQLIAEIASPTKFQDLEFVNHTTFRLPDTGGSGTLPYYLGGTVLLAASALLFMKKRRKGS